MNKEWASHLDFAPKACARSEVFSVNGGVSGGWHGSSTAGWCGYLLLVLTNRFPTTANNDKLRQSLSFFGKEWRKIAGLTEIAIE